MTLAWIVALAALLIAAIWVWRETVWYSIGYFVSWIVVNIAGYLLVGIAYVYGMHTWPASQQWALPILFAIPPVLAAVLVLNVVDRWGSEKGIVKCDWCGASFDIYRFELKTSIKRGLGVYCSGRCKRADEASRGVKEKRVRWIDHE